MTTRMKRRSAPPVSSSPWRPALRWLALLLVVGSAAFYYHYQRQINRHARRAWASFVSGHLTGREKTPLLDGYAVHGIDVSAYQGRIDWAEVSRNHVKFAFIKATEGVTLRDSKFQRNWKAARKAGVYRGAYHYFQPTYDGTKQANLFTRTVPLAPGDLPPVLDVEHAEFHDVAVMRRNVATWLRLVERHYGVRPILYSNYSFYQRYLAGHFDKYPLWLAHYEVDQPRLPREKWIIWQHSDEAYIPGIRGTVDFNVFQGSFQSLLDLRIPPRSAPSSKR
jgi:lysozyme